MKLGEGLALVALAVSFVAYLNYAMTQVVASDRVLKKPRWEESDQLN